MSYGPCMCGGCRRCLHDQGYDCGDPNCRVCAPPERDDYYGEDEDDAEVDDFDDRW